MTAPRSTTQGEWMRNQEKRANRLERRRNINKASDLLGPGYGPTATEIDDWNSETATFGGNFWGSPGTGNSPDVLRAWVGYTLTSDRINGVQVVYDFAAIGASDSYVRRFRNQGDGIRVYDQWVGLTEQIADWDQAKTAGFFRGGGTNAPTPNSYVGVVIPDSQGNVIQQVWRSTATGSGYQVWTRTYNQPTATWQPWVPIYTDTGWLNLTLTPAAVTAGWTRLAVAQVRQRNGEVAFQGGFANAAFSGALTDLATFPTTITPPPTDVAIGLSSGSASIARSVFITVGTRTIQVNCSAVTGSGYYLSPVRYWVN